MTSTNPLILAVQTAKAAVIAATSPAQYREANGALEDAQQALELKLQERYAWLGRNDQKLKEYELTLPPDEFEAKEAIWIAKLREYEAMHRCLEELGVITLPVPVRSKDAVRAEAPAMEQGGLL